MNPQDSNDTNVARFNTWISHLKLSYRLSSRDEQLTFKSVLNVRDLRRVLEQLPNSTYIIYVGDEPAKLAGASPFAPEVLTDDNLSFVYKMSGSFSLDNTNVSDPVLINGASPLLHMIFTCYKFDSGKFVIHPSNIDPANYKLKPLVPTAAVPQKTDKIVYRCNEDQLVFIMSDPTVKWSDRTATCLMFHYPYISDYCNENFTVVPGDIYVPSNRMARGPHNITDPKVLSNLYVTLLGIHLIGPSYTQRDMIAKQIRGRLSAACASQSMESPEEDYIKEIITELGWTSGSSDPVLDEILGQVLAIDHDFKYNYEVTNMTLCDLLALKAKFNLTDIAIALMEQMRLVYAKFHSSSISMALTVYQVALPLISKLGPEFVREINAFKEVADIIGKCPYTGLRSSMPVNLRIGTYPCLVALGVEYYERQLVTQEEKDQFARYNKKTIMEKMQGHTSSQTVQSVASLIPGFDLQTLAMILRTSSLGDAEKLMTGKSEEEARRMYDLLTKEEEPGLWYIQRKQVAEGKELVKISESAKVVMNDRIMTAYTKFRESCDLYENARLRKLNIKNVMAWRDSLLAEVTSWTPIEHSVVESSNLALKHIRDQIIVLVKAMAEKIATANPLISEEDHMDDQ